jgi:hypothetical protein
MFCYVIFISYYNYRVKGMDRLIVQYITTNEKKDLKWKLQQK